MKTLLVIAAVILLVGVAAYAEHARKRGKYRPPGSKFRGTRPGQGNKLIDHREDMFGKGGGHPSAHGVTRDPKKYAQIFVPSSRKDEK